MSNLTIVTAVYYSPTTSPMGGRGWNFTYYQPTLYAISQLNAARVVVYHNIQEEYALKEFIKKYNLSNFELVLCELENLPFYEKIYSIKSKMIEGVPEDKLPLINNRLHILSLAKLWCLEETTKRHGLNETDAVAWIDAGLFHHALFPESTGGVELARFNLKNYYPEHSTSKFNPTFGRKLEELIKETPKLVGFATQVMRLPIEWTSDVAPTHTIAHVAGGLFGGTKDIIENVSKTFYEILENILNSGVVPLEEGILSVILGSNPDAFYVNTFDAWYHDSPTDPCYFLTPEQKVYSFCRSVFDFIEDRKVSPIIIETKHNMFVETGVSIQPQVYENFGLPNIAVYGSHNASIAVEYNGEILEVIEFERLLATKNAGYAQYYVAASRQHLSKIVLEYLKEKYGFTEFGYCLHQHCETLEGDTKVLYWRQFPAKKYIECKHHDSHAAGTFYQSPFEKALIISFDGGGNDGFFKVYKAVRGKPMELLKEYRIDLGFPYMIFGEYLGDVKKENALNLGNLVYAGKILGLQSYGTVRDEWIDAFKRLYKASMTGMDYDAHFARFGEEIGVTFNINARLTGQLAYDVAATSQYAFEETFFELVDDTIRKYEDLPICLSGGCALNIVLNTKVQQKYNRPVFVGPNPNDCGLAVGMLANMLKPTEQIDITYKGVDILDKHKFAEFVEAYTPVAKDVRDVARELSGGNIVGILQGRAEHGPRALGNRSIICNPLIEDMKDKLNARVKHREWYRPFAPIVRLEDVSEYFEWDGESRWMNFCPKVKDEYVKVIPAVVHIDGTARVQTVTREQNALMYDLLTEFKDITGIGVLLNTSFNVDGKPILSTYGDAFKVLERTQLDALYINGLYFSNKINYER